MAVMLVTLFFEVSLYLPWLHRHELKHLTKMVLGWKYLPWLICKLDCCVCKLSLLQLVDGSEHPLLPSTIIHEMYKIKHEMTFYV